MQEVINMENDFLYQWSVVVVLCGSLAATDIVKKAARVATSFEGTELYQEEILLDDTARKLVITYLCRRTFTGGYWMLELKKKRHWNDDI